MTARGFTFSLLLCGGNAIQLHAPSFVRSRPQLARRAPDAEAGALQALDHWFTAAPYASAFCVTALKATGADMLAQVRERRALARGVSSSQAGDTTGESNAPTDTLSVISCDNISCEIVTPQPSPFVWRRTGAFFFYGGLYQGCVQHFIFNHLFPVWFGESTGLLTVASKVLVDQFILTPFLCLPAAYLAKAIAFNYPLNEGLRRYAADARKDLLIKYWTIWGPVQCLTFSVVPPQWRIAFIAFVSFFWLIILSTISSRDDAVPIEQ
jgi:protein Mpv17